MEATTTEDVREHFKPGDTLINSRAETHSVFKVLSTGYGFAAVLLTTRMLGNKTIVYGVWTVSPEGRPACTMTTDDFPAAARAFEARVVKQLRAESGQESGE